MGRKGLQPASQRETSRHSRPTQNQSQNPIKIYQNRLRKSQEQSKLLMEKAQSPSTFNYLFISISARSASINIARIPKAENPIRDELLPADWWKFIKKKRKHFAPKVAPTDSLGHHPHPSAQSPKHPPSKHNNAPRMSGSQSIVVFVAVTQSFNYTVTAREPIPQAAGGP